MTSHFLVSYVGNARRRVRVLGLCARTAVSFVQTNKVYIQRGGIYRIRLKIGPTKANFSGAHGTRTETLRQQAVRKIVSARVHGLAMKEERIFRYNLMWLRGNTSKGKGLAAS